MDRSALSLLLLLSFSSSVLSACSKMSPCKAKCNGVSYDVTKLFHKRVVPDVPGGYNYEFSCDGINCNNRPNTVVCQQKNDGSGREWSVGLANSTKWSITQENPLILTIQYDDGDKEDDKIRSSNVVVAISNTTSFTFSGEDTDTAVYSFNVEGPFKDVKASGAVAAGYIGWILIALFLIGVSVYFITGSILMVTWKGAKGLEIVPNYMFWKDFPLLLKDGLLFTISPCYNTNKSGYQSI